MCKKDEGIVIPNFAALRAAVFSVIYEKPPGGGGYPPPVGARVNPQRTHNFEINYVLKM